MGIDLMLGDRKLYEAIIKTLALRVSELEQELGHTMLENDIGMAMLRKAETESEAEPERDEDDSLVLYVSRPVVALPREGIPHYQQAIFAVAAHSREEAREYASGIVGYDLLLDAAERAAIRAALHETYWEALPGTGGTWAWVGTVE